MRTPKDGWSRAQIAELRRLVDQDLRYDVIARKLGRPSRRAIGGAVYRYITHPEAYTPRPRVAPDVWTDARLTERWADRQKGAAL